MPLSLHIASHGVVFVLLLGCRVRQLASRPLLLRHNFTLWVSTEAYGSRILSSLYILLTLDVTSLPVLVELI